MKTIKVRDAGSGVPKDSTDYEQAMTAVSELISRAVAKGRTARENEHNYDVRETEESTSFTRSGEHPAASRTEYPQGRGPSKLDELEDVVGELYKEVRGIFSDKTFYADQSRFTSKENVKRKSETSRSPHEYLLIPFSWYNEIRREFRGDEISYIDAILILSFILYSYRRGEAISNLILRIRPREIDRVFDIKRGRTLRAIRYLEAEGLIERIVVRGLTPWYQRPDRTPGSYRYVIPYPHRVREITYSTGVRFDGR